MRQPHGMIFHGQRTQPTMAPYWRAAGLWRALSYVAAVMPLLGIVALATVYYDLRRTEVPDWQLLIARAQEANESGKPLEARRLYLQVDRVAYWLKDWQGLIAAGCGISKLDGFTGSHSRTRSMLFRAATIAELAESRQGLATVAKSFSLLGSDEAASAVLARIEPEWSSETVAVDDQILLTGCAR